MAANNNTAAILVYQTCARIDRRALSDSDSVRKAFEADVMLIPLQMTAPKMADNATIECGG